MTLLFIDNTGKKRSNEYFFDSHEDAQSFIIDNQTALLKIHDEQALDGVDFNAGKVRVINLQNTSELLTFFEKDYKYEVNMFKTDQPQKRKRMSLYDALSYFFGDLSVVAPSVVEINGKIIPNEYYHIEGNTLSPLKIHVSEEVSKMILDGIVISSVTVDGVPYGDSLILVNAFPKYEAEFHKNQMFGYMNILNGNNLFVQTIGWDSKVLYRHKQAAFEGLYNHIERYLYDISALERVIDCLPISYFKEDFVQLEHYVDYTNENTWALLEMAQKVLDRRNHLFSKLEAYYNKNGK